MTIYCKDLLNPYHLSSKALFILCPYWVSSDMSRVGYG